MRDYKKTISDLRNFNANYEASKLTNDAAGAIEELLAIFLAAVLLGGVGGYA